MGIQDSIRANLTKDDMISILESELNADINHKLSIVLVEGTDDILFCEKVFNENVVFYESFSGKEGLSELISSCSLNDNRIIAIRDKDYIDERVLPERIFLYDTSCLELMLLKNEEVLSGFCRVFCRNGNAYTDILIDAMRNLSPYSIARKKNEQQDLRIKFPKNFGDLVKEGTEFPIDILFQRAGINDATKELCKKEALELSIEGLYEVTNGHDICLYLACIAKKGKGKSLGRADVSNILICAYRREDFAKTKLYSLIKEYQIKHDLIFVD